MKPSDPWSMRAVAWLGGHWALATPRRTARLLDGFAQTEEQSQLELRRAARLCTDERRRAMYLRHALDEARHARAFAAHAGALSRRVGAERSFRAAVALEGLFERLGEQRFLAFVHHGEQRGRIEFETYARLLRHRGHAPLAALFEGLVLDESEHEAYTARLLEELGGSRGARRELRWAVRSDLFRAVRRRGHGLAFALYSVSMLLVYVLLAPYALAFRWIVRRRVGFSNEP